MENEDLLGGDESGTGLWDSISRCVGLVCDVWEGKGLCAVASQVVLGEGKEERGALQGGKGGSARRKTKQYKACIILAISPILKEWNMFQIFSCHLISICF